jgi:hypothetical protein
MSCSVGSQLTVSSETDEGTRTADVNYPVTGMAADMTVVLPVGFMAVTATL